MPYNTKFKPKKKKPGRARRTTIHQLPTELRGPSNNKWSGHELRSIDLGNLWNPPQKKAPVYKCTPEEIAAMSERLRSEGIID